MWDWNPNLTKSYCNVWCCPSVSQWKLELLNLDWTLTPNVEHPTLSTWTLKVCQWLLHHSTLSIGAIIHNFQIWTLQHDISHRPQRGLYCPPRIPAGFLRIPEDSCPIPGLSIGWCASQFLQSCGGTFLRTGVSPEDFQTGRVLGWKEMWWVTWY